MNALAGPVERHVATPQGRARVWEKGAGHPVCFFAGLGGLPAWLPALDGLARHRRVVVPSLPGFPGGADYEPLDEHLDWVLAAIDLIEAAGLAGCDLVGASVGGALAADVAALRPDLVRKLVLVAPYGLFDPAEPIADVFAQKPGRQSGLISMASEGYDAYRARSGDANETDWTVMQARAEMAAARILWPLGDTRLAKRLFRIACPTLIVWGAEDRVIPPSYAKKFADGISGKTEMLFIPDAGHKVEYDAPDALCEAVVRFIAA